jgi:hypothetical protein
VRRPALPTAAPRDDANRVPGDFGHRFGGALDRISRRTRAQTQAHDKSSQQPRQVGGAILPVATRAIYPPVGSKLTNLAALRAGGPPPDPARTSH